MPMDRSAKRRVAASIAATALAASITLMGCMASADIAQGPSPDVPANDRHVDAMQSLPPTVPAYTLSGGWEQLFFAGR